MRRLRFPFLALIFSWSFFPATVAASSRLVVVSGDSASIEVQTPALITRAFLVANSSNTDREIQDELQLPDGWRLIARDTSFVLQPHESDLRVFGIAIPALTLPGCQKIVYFARDKSDSAAFGQCVTEVTVLPVIKLKITPREVPKRILAGENYSAQFQIDHLGNDPMLINLDVRSSLGSAVCLSSAQIGILPGESVQIVANVKTPSGISRLSTDRLVLAALMSDSSEKTALATSSTAVEVIPRSAPQENVYHRMPTKMATRFVHDDGKGGFQTEYSGSGKLDRKGDWRLDYLIRGPHNLERRVFGQRDEFSIGLQSRYAEVRAGDLLFNLSPLLEQHRLGRGVKAAAGRGPFQAGGYSFQTRQDYSELEEAAGFAGFRVGNLFSARVNYLNKRTAASRHDLASLASTVAPLPNLNLDLEYAIGDGDARRAGFSQAFFARATGKLRGSRLSLSKIYAAPDFPGYYRDQDYNMAEILCPLLKGLRYQASYR
ncbi:MAG: hypothetical protein FJY66_03705, partial [Calditrichaeota bacterium]|nr:hypothetical protein [Calditrichota bacterium]